MKTLILILALISISCARTVREFEFDLLDNSLSPERTEAFGAENREGVIIEVLGATEIGDLGAGNYKSDGSEWVKFEQEEEVTLLNLDELVFPVDGDKVYLDPFHGNDFTGSVNSPARPFKTWKMAAAVAPRGGVIICASGTIEIDSATFNSGISIYGPNTNFVRAQGYAGYMFDNIETFPREFGLTIPINIIAKSITGQDLFRLKGMEVNVFADEIKIIDEGLDNNDVVSISSDIFNVDDADFNLSIKVRLLHSDLRGLADGQHIISREGSVRSDLRVRIEADEVRNVCFEPDNRSATFNGAETFFHLKVNGNIINDRLGFTGGVMGDESFITEPHYDEAFIEVSGRVESLCGAGYGVVGYDSGVMTCRVGGGIFSLDNEPAVILGSGPNTGGDSRGVFTSPIYSSQGAPLGLSASNRNAVFMGGHFTSVNAVGNLLETSHITSLSPPQISSVSASVLFNRCSTDLDFSGAYDTSLGIIDLLTLGTAAGLSNEQSDTMSFLGVLAFFPELNSALISEFKF